MSVLSIGANMILVSGWAYPPGSLESIGRDIFLDYEGNILFEKFYGDTTDDAVRWRTEKLSDNLFAAVGYSDSIGADRHGWALFFDSLGNELYEKKIPRAGSVTARGVDIQQEAIYIVGRSTPGSTIQGWLLKMDTNFQTIWIKTFPEFPGSRVHEFRDIVVFDENDIRIIGMVRDSFTNDYDALLIACDSSGTYQWHKQYTPECRDELVKTDEIWSMEGFGDKHVVMVGSGNPEAGSLYNAWVLTVDSLGNRASCDTATFIAEIEEDIPISAWSSGSTISVEIGDIPLAATDVFIYDLLGKLRHEERITRNSFSEIPTSGYPAGLYVVSVPALGWSLPVVMF
jgi:hypothetical protein